MTEHNLINISNNQLRAIWTQLKAHLEALDRADIPKKVRASVKLMHRELENHQGAVQRGEISDSFAKALEISHTLDFLRLAVQQRSSIRLPPRGGWFTELLRNLFLSRYPPEQLESNIATQLDEIENLIQSCYKPFEQYLVAPPNSEQKPIPPNEIRAVYFQSEYLARPKGPVPFLIVPNYFEGDRLEEWIGVAHETGHHIFRQVPGLREELEVTLGKVLQNPSATLNGQPGEIKKSQQRLWFNYLEETFADLIGVMSLGAAFVFAQHVMIRGSVTTANLEKLLMGEDLTHPIPLIRGQMGVYMYERLLSMGTQNPDRTDLTTLTKEWAEVTNQLIERPLKDPHMPKAEFLADQWNPGGDLEYQETIAVMKLIVDAMLHTKLLSLGCNSLSQLVDFSKDEANRLTAAGRQAIPGDSTDVRIRVAARRLVLHRTANT